jgi:hypothetical protein
MLAQVSYFRVFQKLLNMKFAINSFIIASLASGIEAFGSSFAPSSNKLHRVESASSLKMSLEQYSDELKETAAKMVRP